ncbi:hypothetical protein ASG92_22195 [Arthrobacter sp. Soil736]|uniref:hypothetical protein n=1 Tax=Arthrobacter sp. Soil736 TaxID=1736395 RepID=UPI0006F327C1|nr:hypothetical protein [Arthrobacter sp. Soil736]KRE59997.1 hypothetical protein ASG92_22195 [Arthrobacter sp. Soil736]
MELGFTTAKDLLEVLFVPLSAAMLALLWPAMAARRRRSNFEDLISRELAEAAPYAGDFDGPWHTHLARRFLHEEILGHPVDNTDFVLSLEPELSYHLSQMWIAYTKAQKTTNANQPSQPHAEQFCWHLRQTAHYLDQKHRSDLVKTVAEPWAALVRQEYPNAKV